MATIILKETRDFDSRGNLIDYDVEEQPQELLEPFDPAYLEDSVDDGTHITRGEKSYCKKIGRVQRALDNAGVRYHWTGTCFELVKMNKDLRYVRCVWVDEDGDFCYGDYDRCLYYGKVSEVVGRAKKFMQ